MFADDVFVAAFVAVAVVFTATVFDWLTFIFVFERVGSFLQENDNRKTIKIKK